MKSLTEGRRPRGDQMGQKLKAEAVLSFRYERPRGENGLSVGEYTLEVEAKQKRTKCGRAKCSHGSWRLVMQYWGKGRLRQLKEIEQEKIPSS